MSAELQVRRAAQHLELVLNRPECRNALSRTLLAELTTALRAAAADRDVRSVILTGAPPAFCAGLDLREVPPVGAAGDNAPLFELCETIDALAKPVIAAVNGPAVAGGAALVTVCDLVVLGESSSIGYPGVQRGLVAPLVMTYLGRCVGERAAKYLLLTGAQLSAERALELGLADAVVPDTDVLPWAREHAATFARLPARAVAETKTLWRRMRACGETERQRLNAALWRYAADAEAAP